MRYFFPAGGVLCVFWFERSNGHPRAERDGDAEKGCQKPATQQKTILNWWSGCLWAGPGGVVSDEKTKGLGERNIPSFMARTPTARFRGRSPLFTRWGAVDT